MNMNQNMNTNNNNNFNNSHPSSTTTNQPSFNMDYFNKNMEKKKVDLLLLMMDDYY